MFENTQRFFTKFPLSGISYLLCNKSTLTHCAQEVVEHAGDVDSTSGRGG